MVCSKGSKKDYESKYSDKSASKKKRETFANDDGDSDEEGFEQFKNKRGNEYKKATERYTSW